MRPQTHARASAPDHRYYAAVKDRQDGKRAAISEARKLLRRPATSWPSSATTRSPPPDPAPHGGHLGVAALRAANSPDTSDSRLAVIERNFRNLGRSLRNAAPPYYFVSCITDAMISMDGSAIVCGYSTSVGNTTTMGFAQYSTGTGKMNHVVGLVHFEGNAPIGISLYWVNSTGKIAIGTSETTGGGRVGVMNGDTFTPLPGVTGFEAIAW